MDGFLIYYFCKRYLFFETVLSMFESSYSSIFPVLSLLTLLTNWIKHISQLHPLSESVDTLTIYLRVSSFL